MNSNPEQATILVVDDQPEIVEGIALTLELENYRVLSATDGDAALRLIESDTVDLVIADIAMPQLNGYQLYDAIRANSKWTMIPIIFLTARSLESDVRYGKSLGVDDYLTKPIRPEDLLATIQGRLKRTRQISAHRAANDLHGGNNGRPEGPRLVPGRYQISLSGEPVKLSKREAKALDHLLEHVGQPVPISDLVRATHGLELDDVEAGSLIRPLIRSLRRKLGYGVGEVGCIENVRGIGYLLNLPNQDHTE